MVEGARLESVYTPKAYRGFESLPLCIYSRKAPLLLGACFFGVRFGVPLAKSYSSTACNNSQKPIDLISSFFTVLNCIIFS